MVALPYPCPSCGKPIHNYRGACGICGYAPTESWADEVARLRREIGEREARLRHLILGDPRKRVTVPTEE